MDHPADTRPDDRRYPSPPRAVGDSRVAAERTPAGEGGQYRLTVVTRAGAGLGFRLAGVLVEELAEANAAERIAALLEEPNLGVLAVEDNLLRHVPEAVIERPGRSGVPVLLPFTLPKRWGEGSGGEAYVAALVRRAIGYHIKIQA